MLSETFALAVDEDTESNSEDGSTEAGNQPVEAAAAAAATALVNEDQNVEESKDHQPGAADTEQDQPSNTRRSEG